MDFSMTLKKVADGDTAAFCELYRTVAKQLYYIAYYSLGNEKNAVEAVKKAAALCFVNCSFCKSPETFRAHFVEILSDCIVSHFKAVRKSGVKAEVSFDVSTKLGYYISKLTEAERLTVSIWVFCGYNAHQISIVTGLREEIAQQKLKSAQEKLSEIDDVLYL